MSAPDRLLSRGSITVTWFRATVEREIVIPYPEPKPPTIYPAGTCGWWRPTSKRWGEFLPDDTERAGVAMHIDGLAISEDFEQTTYDLSPRYREGEEA